MMRLVIYEQEAVELVRFADQHGLVMEVRERTFDFKPDMKYYAYFRDVEVKDGSFLRSVTGNGHTHTAAIEDYAKRISNVRLVVGATRDDRREMDTPRLVFTSRNGVYEEKAVRR